MNYKDSLENFIKTEILRNRNAKIGENDDLIGAGILDSLGVLQIITFIEKSFKIRVKDEDVVYENFNSLGTIVNYLESVQPS
jgi:acyl carrier protein